MYYPVDHIGIAVHDLVRGSKQIMRAHGGRVTHEEIMLSQGIKVWFVETERFCFELLQPIRIQSPVAKFLNRRGEGVHHIAFKVPDISEAFERMMSKGFQILQETPTRGARGKEIFFIHPRDMGGLLTEMCQSPL